MEWAGYSAIFAGLVVLATIGTWVWRLSGLVAGSTKSSESLSIGIAKIGLEIERLEKDLVEHRVTVAREYVSKETLTSLESRIVEAINNLGDRLDKKFMHMTRGKAS
jgi:hypothetical protein